MLNQPSSPADDEALRALAHPGRRAMLRLVWDGERPATELAEAARLSPSAASQHLKVLREAGLVTVRVDANRRLYRADLERVRAVAAFLDEFWADPLARLRHAAETAPTAAETAPTASGAAPTASGAGQVEDSAGEAGRR